MSGLQTLAARVNQGDATAVAEFRQELETQMVRIVRRTMRKRAGTSALSRRILAEADREARPVGRPEGKAEGLVGRIARRICESVVGKLRPGTAENTMNDTVWN